MTTRHYLGTAYQRAGESIAYTIDMSNIGTPTSPSATIEDKTAFGTDLTGTNLSGSSSVSSNTITTPLVTALVAGTDYRVVVSSTISGNTVEVYFDVECTDDE